MKYIIGYDIAYDLGFQCEIPDGLAEKMKKSGTSTRISDVPLEGLPIMSRYYSERHPECASEYISFPTFPGAAA